MTPGQNNQKEKRERDAERRGQGRRSVEENRKEEMESNAARKGVYAGQPERCVYMLHLTETQCKTIDTRERRPTNWREKVREWKAGKSAP